jgi:hypothetical protein
VPPSSPEAHASAAAAATGTPTLVRDAFMPVEPLRVADLVLHPLTLSTYMLLEQLESPFIESDFLKTIEENPEAITFADIATATYVLTRHTKASRAVLQRGRAAFDEAVADFANEITAPDLLPLSQKLGLHIGGAFATVIASAEKKTPAAEQPTPSSSSAPEATDSAGR